MMKVPRLDLFNIELPEFSLDQHEAEPEESVVALGDGHATPSRRLRSFVQTRQTSISHTLGRAQSLS